MVDNQIFSSRSSQSLLNNHSYSTHSLTFPLFLFNNPSCQFGLGLSTSQLYGAKFGYPHRVKYCKSNRTNRPQYSRIAEVQALNDYVFEDEPSSLRTSTASNKVTVSTSTPIASNSLATSNTSVTSSKDLNSILEESYRLLDWQLLSSYLSRFTSTPQARKSLLPKSQSQTSANRDLSYSSSSSSSSSVSSSYGLYVAQSLPQAQQLLQQTYECIQIEQEMQTATGKCCWGGFKGVADDVEYNASLAKKGATLGTTDLVQIAQTLKAARFIRKVVLKAEKKHKKKKMKDDDEDFDTEEGDDDDNDNDNENDNNFDSASTHFPQLRALVASMNISLPIEREIFRCITDSADVRDNASEKLAELREKNRLYESEIIDALQTDITRYGDVLQNKSPSIRNDRYVLQVKAAYKYRVPGVVQDESATGSTVFIEPKSIMNINSRVRANLKKEKEEINVILKKLSQLVGNIADDIAHLSEVIVIVDLAVARARFSMYMKAVRPTFADESKKSSKLSLNLKRLRHPVLIWQALDQLRQEKRIIDEGSALFTAFDLVVPADYRMNKEVKCVILTGPNTGGKTISLKNLGIAVLMAKAGLYVAAEEPAEIPYFDYVFADIGDDQSIVQSLSTFSGHIERVKRILNNATESSLVLLDEVGSGTDPAEGSALGMSLLRYLADKVKLTMGTTHHGELKTLKYSDDSGKFENASVEFDDQKMAPTYRLLWGIPGRSNALSIAQRLGLPMNIIADAKESITGSNGVDVGKIISSLEKARADAEEQENYFLRESKEVEKIKNELEMQRQKLDLAERKIREYQKNLLSEEVSKAQTQIASVVKKLQKGDGSGAKALSQNALAAREEIDEISRRFVEENIGEEIEEVKVKDWNINVGDQISIPKYGSALGRVLKKPNQKGDFTVSFGMIKAKVNVSEIVQVIRAENAEVSGANIGVPSIKPKQKVAVSGKRAPAVQTPSNTIDVRGETVDDAIYAIERGVSNCMMMGNMWIIHGHGTGKLRKGIWDYLKISSFVDSFEHAPSNQGGSGATIVYLK